MDPLGVWVPVLASMRDARGPVGTLDAGADGGAAVAAAVALGPDGGTSSDFGPVGGAVCHEVAAGTVVVLAATSVGVEVAIFAQRDLPLAAGCVDVDAGAGAAAESVDRGRETSWREICASSSSSWPSSGRLRRGAGSRDDPLEECWSSRCLSDILCVSRLRSQPLSSSSSSCLYL